MDPSVNLFVMFLYPTVLKRRVGKFLNSVPFNVNP